MTLFIILNSEHVTRRPERATRLQELPTCEHRSSAASVANCK